MNKPCSVIVVGTFYCVSLADLKDLRPVVFIGNVNCEFAGVAPQTCLKN